MKNKTAIEIVHFLNENSEDGYLMPIEALEKFIGKRLSVQMKGRLYKLCHFAYRGDGINCTFLNNNVLDVCRGLAVRDAINAAGG